MKREDTAPPPSEPTTHNLLAYVQEVATELHPRRHPPAVTLDTSLERELRIDSLGRVELLHRLERAFDVRLPDQLLATAETPRDLLRAVQAAGSTTAAFTMETEGTTTTALEREDATPEHAQTLLDTLAWHLQMHPDRPHIHLYDDDGHEEVITYAMLYEESHTVAAGLQARGILPGETVALMLPTSRAFFLSFVGILLAGATPVPIYPPLRRSQLEAHMRRQAQILSNAGCKLLITVAEAQPIARLLRTQLMELRSVVTMQELIAPDQSYSQPTINPTDMALLQYTSGSTGTPKGVILSHANLLANIRAMNAVAGTTSRDLFVSWLPLYHDMGLIGAWLGSLYCAYPVALMSPLAFLAHPARWLWTLHRHKGTISGGPNFAYELCAQKIDDRDLEGLDLSSWRLAFNGAEPVSPDTISRFTTRFAPYGFRPEAMLPVYGLAEATLGLAFPPPQRGTHIDRIQRDAFLRSGRALTTSDDDPHALRFVACGRPLPDFQIRIVDAMGYEAPERQEGRLEFQGPSVTSGYFRNPEATAALFHGDWLDSGDMAYMAEGELYLTGRAKDIIIRAGRNLYPQELEEAVGDVPGIRKGCVAVFGSRDPVSGTEHLVVLAETRETDEETLAALHRQIDELAIELVGSPPDDVVLAPPHTVLKTSSGKIRRSATCESYERGELRQGETSVWWQVVRLASAGLRPQLRRVRQSAMLVAYAAYLWTLTVLAAPVICVAAIVPPRQAWRQAAVAKLLRGILFLTRLPLQVEGLDQLRQPGPCVYVVNHASYLDAVVLFATLPQGLRYVAKQELAGHFFSRLPLQGLGVKFVERFEVQRGVEDATRLAKIAQAGGQLVFFPEGTFGREPGLRPFRMGAFTIAAQANVPVIPVAIRGTRSVLRADQWFPRWGPVRVTVGTPIEPTGTDWSAAIALRDAARAQILRFCGEPDLEPASAAEYPAAPEV